MLSGTSCVSTRRYGSTTQRHQYLTTWERERVELSGPCGGCSFSLRLCYLFASMIRCILQLQVSQRPFVPFFFCSCSAVSCSVLQPVFRISRIVHGYHGHQKNPEDACWCVVLTFNSASLSRRQCSTTTVNSWVTEWTHTHSTLSYCYKVIFILYLLLFDVLFCC